MHNPRVIATIQQSGRCPSRTFGSMNFGFAPYLPDTLLHLQPYSSFAHYQEMQPRPARIVMRQRQRDFAACKCTMQQWLWDDMDSDMRLRVAYLCLCVAELHAVSGSPDLFQLTPELVHVISTLPNLQPTLGFKRTGPAVNVSNDTPLSGVPTAAAAPATAAAAESAADSAIATDVASSKVYTSNKQRKKATQQVRVCISLVLERAHLTTREQAKMEAWAHAHAENEAAAEILSRTHKTKPQQPMPTPPEATLVPSLSSYEGRCSAASPCKWIIARRDGGVGELVGAMLLVYSGDTAFGLFTGLDYAASKDCRA